MMIRRVTRNIAALSIAAILLFAHTPDTAFAGDSAKFTAQLDAASTASNPITISSAEELYEFAQFVNGYGAAAESAGSKTLYPHGYYKLTRDIDLSAYGAGWNGGEGWTPIGTVDSYLEGVFDGGGHVITGLYIFDPETIGSAAGLFGVSSGLIKNLGLVGVNITGNFHAGGVAGDVHKGSIDNCFVTGSISGDRYVGGIAGEVFMGTISNCYTTCVVLGSTDYLRGKDIGGVAGSIQDASVKSCYATGSVTGNRSIGGVVGSAETFDRNTIINCVALNLFVNGEYDVGRVLGSHYYYSVKTESTTFFAGIMFGGNYALKDMSVTDMDKKDTKNGVDITVTNSISKSFWTEKLFFDESVWVLEDGKLPILRGLAGQDGTPNSNRLSRIMYPESLI